MNSNIINSFIILVALAALGSLFNVTRATPSSVNNKGGTAKFSSDSVRVIEKIDSSGSFFKTDLQKSLQLSEQALEIAESTGEPELCFKANKALGHAYFRLSQFDRAVDCYLTALDFAEQTGNDLLLADAFTQIGVVNTYIGNQNAAKDELLKAAAIFDERNNPTDNNFLTPLYSYLGAVYSELEQEPEADLYFSKSIELARQSQRTDVLFSVLNNAGRHYLSFQKYDKVKSTLGEALALGKELGDYFNLSYAYCYLAGAYLKQHEYNEAVQYYNEGFKLACNYNHLVMQWEISKQLADHYITVLQVDSAKKYYNLFLTFDDQLNFSETQDNVIRRQMTESYKDLQLIDSQTRNKYRKLFRVILIITVLLLCSLAVYLYLLRQKQKTLQNFESEYAEKVNTKETELDEYRSELSRKNKELATKVLYQFREKQRLAELKNEINQMIADYDDNEKIVNSITKKLTHISEAKGWPEFERLFLDVNPNFYNSLLEYHPGLTLNDKKIAAFTLLKLSAKEMAQISQKSVRSIKVARKRLCEKLNVDEIELFEYISKFQES